MNAETRRILDEINADEAARKERERRTPDERLPMLSIAEANFHRHMQMWGSEAYPISKAAQTPTRFRWLWREAFGIEGSPVCFRTKKAAFTAVEAYLDILHDRIAGRLPCPHSGPGWAQ